MATTEQERINELEMRVSLLEHQLRLCLEKLDGGHIHKRSMQFKKYQEIGEMSLLDFEGDEQT